jgi:cytoskeletal protein RodZ
VRSLFKQLWTWLVLSALALAATVWWALIRPRRRNARTARDHNGASVTTPATAARRLLPQAVQRRPAEPKPARAATGTTTARSGATDSATRAGATGSTTRAGGTGAADARGKATAEPRGDVGAVWHAPTATAQSIEEGPYPGSAIPIQGGAAPSPEFVVKGNQDSMLYHTPESPFFGVTRAEIWFRSEADAQRAGFAAWR